MLTHNSVFFDPWLGVGLLLQTHQTIHVIPAVVTVVCRRIAVAAAAAVPVATSLPNQSPESAEVASAATSADATDALADRER